MLQGQVTGPRESSADRRIAKTHESSRSTGSDGKHYQKVAMEDEDKYRVLDAEGLKIEERRTSDLKRSIQLNYGGSKKSVDGMARTNTVGTASHATKIRTLHHLDSASGAESKVIETIRNGDVGILDAKGSPGSTRRDRGHKGSPTSSPQSKVKISTKTMTLSPQSKAYEKNLSSIAAEMFSSEDDFGAKLHAPRSGGDEALPQSSSAAGLKSSGRGSLSALRPSSAPNPTRASSQHRSFLTKEEAVQLHLKREEEVRKEAEDFAEKERQRFHRASQHGREFTAMLRRAEMCHEKNQAKMAMKLAAQEKAAREEKEERERKNFEHLRKELNPASALSWREIQEASEIARREAVEKRKAEMAASSRAPAAASSSAADTEKQMRAAAKAAEFAAANTKSFKAADPEKVAEKLAKQNAAWERKLEEERERVRQRMAERLLNAAGKPAKSPTAAMEERAAAAAVRRAARQSAKDEKLKAEAKKKTDMERRKTEILFNTKVPEEGRKLTKSAENRARMVRAALEKEVADKKKEAADKAIKAKQEREISRMLQHQISDAERDRREQMKGGYRELSESELEMNRREAKREYQRQLKENKDRLEEVLLNRPSLLQRHERAIAAKSAASSALNKVARAVTSSSSSSNGKKGGVAASGEYDFDFFTDEENIKLTATRGL